MKPCIGHDFQHLAGVTSKVFMTHKSGKLWYLHSSERIDFNVASNGLISIMSIY